MAASAETSRANLAKANENRAALQDFRRRCKSYELTLPDLFEEFHWGAGRSLQHEALTEAWVIVRDYPSCGYVIAFPCSLRPGGGALIAATALVRYPPSRRV